MNRYLSILFGCMLLSQQEIFAQGEWTLKFRPSLSFSTTKVNDSYLNTGFGFDFFVGYPFTPSLTGEAGWGKNIFPAQKTPGHFKDGYEESWFLVGIQFYRPLSASKLGLVAGADGLINHVNTVNRIANGENSGPGFGWRVNSGLSYSISNRLSISPEFSYTYLTVKLKERDDRLLLRYMSFGIQFIYATGKINNRGMTDL